MRRRGEWKARLAQRDARVDGPAGEAVDGAQARHEAELAQRTEPALLRDRVVRDVAGDAETQADVVGQQPVMAAPALECHAEVRCGDRRSAQHAVAAPRQLA